MGWLPSRQVWKVLISLCSESLRKTRRLHYRKNGTMNKANKYLSDAKELGLANEILRLAGAYFTRMRPSRY